MESLTLHKSVSSSGIQIFEKVRSRTGSTECFCSSREEFLADNKARNYAELVINMLIAFRNLGCNMRIKMHCLISHMHRFPENMRSVSDGEHGKDGDQLSETLAFSHDGCLLLDFEERHPCR